MCKLPVFVPTGKSFHKIVIKRHCLRGGGNGLAVETPPRAEEELEELKHRPSMAQESK